MELAIEQSKIAVERTVVNIEERIHWQERFVSLIIGLHRRASEALEMIGSVQCLDPVRH
jgi:hypothetical protein